MKKLFFAFFFLSIGLVTQSCKSDGCSVMGTWSVSDVKLESPQFAESMLDMMKTEYLATTYTFNADGTMTITNSNQMPAPGTYKLDTATNELTWQDDATQAKNVMKILACTDGSIQFVQRMPADPAQEMLVQATLTLVPKQ